jgi:hypothetical protein
MDELEDIMENKKCHSKNYKYLWLHSSGGLRVIKFTEIVTRTVARGAGDRGNGEFLSWE